MLRILIVLIVVLSLVIFTEALTEIITKSELFSPIRKFFFDRRQTRFCNFIHELLDCGYCISVWIGFFSAYVFLFVDNIIFSIFFMGIIFHRLSNILHYLIDRVNRNHDSNLE
jgi:hypothetical protein